jgi:hypothetical protein
VRLALLFGEEGRRSGAAAAGLVRDLHAHGQELLFLDHYRHGARQHVRAAARAGVDHDLDRTAWRKRLRERRDGERHAECQHG